MTKKTSTRYAPEVRERAVRMVLEHEGDHGSQCGRLTLLQAAFMCQQSPHRFGQPRYRKCDIRHFDPIP